MRSPMSRPERDPYRRPFAWAACLAARWRGRGAVEPDHPVKADAGPPDSGGTSSGGPTFQGATGAAATRRAAVASVSKQATNIRSTWSSGSTSFSMDFDDKWTNVKAALESFVTNPAYADLGIGLQFFPIRSSAACPTIRRSPSLLVQRRRCRPPSRRRSTRR